jgi:hypothetical protein
MHDKDISEYDAFAERPITKVLLMKKDLRDRTSLTDQFNVIDIGLKIASPVGGLLELASNQASSVMFHHQVYIEVDGGVLQMILNFTVDGLQIIDYERMVQEYLDEYNRTG